MPLMPCRRDYKPGYKWGEEGHCYTYTPGDGPAKERARQRALAQGRAIQAQSEGKVTKTTD